MELEILIPVIVAVFSSLTSYLLAVNKGRTELRALEKETDLAIQTIKEQHRNELEKLEKEFELKAKYGESEAQTELLKGFVGEMMSAPEIKEKIMGEAMKQISK